MESPKESLELEHLWVVCPAGRGYSLAEGVSVVALEDWKPPKE